MKRDMSLVREILLWAIDQPTGYVGRNPEIAGRTEEEIAYHVALMREAGLVTAAMRGAMSSDSPAGILNSVTWMGHEFAASAEDNALWKRATATLLKEGAAVSFDLLKAWLANEAKRQFGLPP